VTAHELDLLHALAVVLCLTDLHLLLLYKHFGMEQLKFKLTTFPETKIIINCSFSVTPEAVCAYEDSGGL